MKIIVLAATLGLSMSCKSVPTSHSAASADLTKPNAASDSWLSDRDMEALSDLVLTFDLEEGFYGHRSGISGNWREYPGRIYPAADRNAGFKSTKTSGTAKQFFDAKANMLQLQKLRLKDDIYSGLQLFQQMEALAKAQRNMPYQEFRKTVFIVELPYYRAWVGVDYLVGKAKFWIKPENLLAAAKASQALVINPQSQYRATNAEELQLANARLSLRGKDAAPSYREAVGAAVSEKKAREFIQKNALKSETLNDRLRSRERQSETHRRR